MPGMLDLIALVKNTGLPWEILTATGEINRPLVVADKMAGREAKPVKEIVAQYQ